MIRSAALIVAGLFALTACQPTDVTAAQKACERLVTPDTTATFEHVTTTRKGDTWTVAGVVTIGASTDQYKCHVELHDTEPTGYVYYVTQ